uniref:Uncharacterized protein n=1 Tax=Nelumbo nucifera TaxID=4432 RepID=A0A822XYT8_NELNU|nr:TPA_asm: hypothetical protein HUJ06_026911 [Nelumbo nucifera]
MLLLLQMSHQMGIETLGLQAIILMEIKAVEKNQLHEEELLDRWMKD